MALKTIDQSPKITDVIRFTIKTPGADGCLTADPYKVDNISIYYVERDFLGTNWGEYQKVIYNASLVQELEELQKQFCDDPSDHVLFRIQEVQNELASKAQSTTYYYKDALLVANFGTAESPAWLSTDTGEAYLAKSYEDENNETIDLPPGVFYLDWTPRATVREGDFFICWTWTPLPAGDSLAAHESFSLWGDGRAVQTIPSHITPEGKYETLLERYLPEMYKSDLVDGDLSPSVTDKLNRSIAGGFTFVEDFANQIIDLYDANVLHESLLVYLANMFDLKLKSEDPTLWRRQIKQAVPLFKKKGTMGGLADAFAQAGMTLDKYTALWQVVSPYTWQESFRVKNSPTFKLDKTPIRDIDPANFGVWVRREDEEDYVEVSNDCVTFSEKNCEHFVTWIGDELSASPNYLYEGDVLRILYQHAEIPAGRQPIENYIRSLSLADTRDELDQEYPPKNWNVRVIEEDDPLFDVIIPVRHPFHDPLIFGMVRTEFPFSENIYNMEEYNGSTRESTDVCFIDKAFRDPCGSCLSSKYNIDIGIENLSNDRLAEVRDILREYTPFSSVPHQISFRGEINEFVQSPVEEIEVLVHINLVEYVISGGANPFFHRVMEDGLTNWIVDREMLAQDTVVVSNKTGTAYNRSVGLIAPNVNFSNIGLDIDNHIMEVLAPSPNTGTFRINAVNNETALVGSAVMEPLNTSGFTFRLSNIILRPSNLTITQADYTCIGDNEEDLSLLQIHTLWDVANTPDYAGGTWKLHLPSTGQLYDISRFEDGKFFIASTIPTSATLTYHLYDDDDNLILSSNTGFSTLNKRGKVVFNDPNLVDIQEFVRHGDWFLYDNVEYLVSAFFDEKSFYIDEYTDGTASGVSAQVLRRLVPAETGYFQYQGLKLLTEFDHETEFGILNGSGSPELDPNLVTDNSLFKECFLINIGDYYYKIEDIFGTEVTLSGYPQDWGTLVSGGTTVKYAIHHFVKDTVETQFVVFDQIDRRGKDVVIREIESSVTNDVAIVALSQTPGSGIEDVVAQEESISFVIEYDDGRVERGDV